MRCASYNEGVSHEHRSHEYPSFIKSLGEPEISSSSVQTQDERGVLISTAFLLPVSFYIWLFPLPKGYNDLEH